MSVFGGILVCIFPAFSAIRTEYGKILRISPYSEGMRAEKEPALIFMIIFSQLWLLLSLSLNLCLKISNSLLQAN